MSTIVFRVDSSIDMGTGHVMRCLTLAAALHERGAICHFICRDLPGHISDIIADKGYDTHILPAVSMQDIAETAADEDDLGHQHWLVAGWQRDQAETADCLEKITRYGPIKAIVVDHYGIDARWEVPFRDQGYVVMVIDDLNDRAHACDILLDQTALKDPHLYAGLVPEDCQLCIGADYALLRPEFAEWRAKSLARREGLQQVGHILVTMGGMDIHNATGLTLEALELCSLTADVKVTVIMGAKSPHLQHVEAYCQQSSMAIDLCVGVDNMAELMSAADLCIGAAGSTSWERCALGLPAINLVLAENQKAACALLESAGAVVSAGPVSELAMENLAHEYIMLLLNDMTALRKMTAVSASLCKGDGAVKMTEIVMAQIAGTS